MCFYLIPIPPPPSRIFLLRVYNCVIYHMVPCWGGGKGGDVDDPCFPPTQVVCDSFLKKIQKVEFDPLHPQLTHRDPLLAYRLLWKAICKNY